MLTVIGNNFGRAAVLVCSLIFGQAVQAATVWAVVSGEAPNSNSPGSALEMGTESVRVDLYMDTLADTSYGWDFTLEVLGAGVISNVAGEFVDPAFGVALPSGGWRQLGGDLFGQTGEFLVISFDFLGDFGASVEFSGVFTNSSFNDELLASSTLMQVVQPVPLPGAVWLMASAILGVVGLGRRRAAWAAEA